jgi:hypothetical protein
MPPALLDLLFDSLVSLSASPISDVVGRNCSALNFAGMGGTSALLETGSIAAASWPETRRVGRVLRRRTAAPGTSNGLLMSRGFSRALLGNSTAYGERTLVPSTGGMAMVNGVERIRCGARWASSWTSLKESRGGGRPCGSLLWYACRCWFGVATRFDLLRPKILRTTSRIDPFLWPDSFNPS